MFLLIGTFLVSCGKSEDVGKVETTTEASTLDEGESSYDLGCFTVELPESYDLIFKSPIHTKLVNEEDSVEISVFVFQQFFGDMSVSYFEDLIMGFSEKSYKTKVDMESHISSHHIAYYSTDYDILDGKEHNNCFVFIIPETRFVAAVAIHYEPKDEEKGEAICKQFVESIRKTEEYSFDFMCNKMDSLIDGYVEIEKKKDNYFSDTNWLDMEVDDYLDLDDELDEYEDGIDELKERLEKTDLKSLSDEEYKRYEDVMDKYDDKIK